MKHTILTIALLAATICSYATPIDEAPSTPPTNVIDAFEDITDWYYDSKHSIISQQRNPNDNSIVASIKVLPFEINGTRKKIEDIKSAFERDKEVGYQYALYEPGQGGKVRVYTGVTDFEEIVTREDIDQGYYYINVKNNDNPSLRDHYGIQWQLLDENPEKIKGKIFYITSMRPDIVKKNAEKTDPFKMFFDKSGITSVLPNDYGVDSCLVSDISKQYSSLQKQLDKQLKERRNLNDRYASPYQRYTAGINNSKVERQLNAYKQLLEMQQEQIDKLQEDYKNNFKNPGAQREINKRLRKLHKEAQKTSDDMQKLIRQIH